MRLDALLVVSGGALAGSAATTAPAAAVACALWVAFALVGWASRAALVVALLAFGLTAVRAREATAAYDAARVAARDALGPPAVCVARARVESSPALAHGALSFTAVVAEADCEGRRMRGPFVVRLHGGPPDVVRGDTLEVIAKLGPVRLFRNADLPDPTPRTARHGTVLSGGVLAASRVERGNGPGAWMDRARAHARRRIDATFSDEAAPLGRALVLGENDLDPEDDEAFRRSGLAHLLAVSGTHLVFAVASIVSLVGALLVRVERLAASFDVRRLSSAFGAVLALLYADFAGGSGSAWRAAWMLAAAYAAIALGRRPRGARVLGLSVLTGLALDPLAAYDVSFLLSAAATSGLLTIGRPLAQLAGRAPSLPLRWVGGSVAATVASMIPCAPLLAMLAPDLGLVGVVANVIAAPVGEMVALPLCLVHTLLEPAPLLERGVALVGSGALLFVRAVARVSASVEILRLTLPPPTAWHYGMLVGAAASVAALRVRARAPRSVVAAAVVVGVFGLAAVERAAANAGTVRATLRVTALDVEQGDAALVDLPDGSLVLIDGGGFVGSTLDPGERVILPVLRARRRAALRAVVVSHPHPDHFGGLVSVVGAIHAGELWDTGQGTAEGAGPVHAHLLGLAAERGARILRPRNLCGPPRELGGALVEVLAPCPDFVRGAHANDNSLVVRIEYGSRSVLFVGDAERDQEARLVRDGRRLSADLLKVGHHGSRTSSTPPFLAAVRPRDAIVSSGVRNRFGHPHPEAMAALDQIGATTHRTDRVGSVSWQTDGASADVRTFSVAR